MTATGMKPEAPADSERRKNAAAQRARLKRRLAQFEIVHEDASCTLRYAPGTSNRIVVAFCGIRGALGSLTHRQIAKAGNANRRNHVIYVADKTKGWYSAPGLAETIVDVTNGEIDEIRAEHDPSGAWEVVCLGSSMGGFGALLFAERLGARRAVSFVPQYAMEMSIVPDARIEKFLRNIDTQHVETLGSHLTGSVESYAVFGSQEGDLLHLKAFPAECGLRSWVIDHPHHGVLEFLKDRDLLDDTIDALLTGDLAGADALLQPFLIPSAHPTGHVART